MSFDSKGFLRTVSSGPGVYRMLDGGGAVLYVGKARNLKKRLASYFRRIPDSSKTRALVSQIAAVEVTVTHTETEALILENSQIKHFQPRYNVLLRDDKSYPWIHVSTAHAFPRLVFHRGTKRTKGRYFGPFPSAPAVRESIQHLQKLFQLRNCEDTEFANRSRPCLQYQIKRCSAPCVGLVDADAYRRDVEHALMFLEGRNEQVVDALVQRMEQAAAAQDYELAARYRDQIAHLRQAQEQQRVLRNGGDLDVIAVACDAGHAVVAALFVRAGRLLGHRTYTPRISEGTPVEELVGAFLAQYYLGREMPSEIVVSHDFADRELLERTLSEARGAKVRIRTDVRAERRRWLEMARDNATHALAVHLATDKALGVRLEVQGVEDTGPVKDDRQDGLIALNPAEPEVLGNHASLTLGADHCFANAMDYMNIIAMV
jgi:excinuclease ABC subunit C